MSEEQLVQLLEAARRSNDRDGITGMLVYSQGSFIQVLEGEREVVDRTLARIEHDSRHRGIIRLYTREITEREFPGWSMGFAHADREDLLNIPGSNDFFTDGECVADLESSWAKTLLDRFRKTAA